MAGFTLIEALVSILVLAFGLLGLGLLQAQGMKFNTDAYARTQAAVLAYDIIDRMRASGAPLADYTDGDPGGACVADGTTVENDLNCWYDALEANLPGQPDDGHGDIALDGTNEITVTVRWQERAISRDNPSAPVVNREVAWVVEL